MLCKKINKQVTVIEIPTRVGIFFGCMETKIAIQGIKGSFHHQVAQQYFEQIDGLDECMSFDDLVNSLINNRSQKGVMALENSIAGSIIPNYANCSSNRISYWRINC